jgi:hypothetical protein
MQSSFDFKGATLCEFAFSTCGFTEDIFAVVAGNYGLGMTEDDCSFVAASALNVHEIGVGSWDESFEFVGLSFLIEGGME